VGQTVAEAEVKITDDLGNILAAGINGYLSLRTPYQAKGYWKTADNNDTGFQDGWFLPGDTGVLSETGELRVTGRIDELINAAGIKLNPAVIDAKLLGYRGIQDLAAFGYLEPGAVHKQLGVAIVTNGSISIEQFNLRLKQTVPETNQIVIFHVAEIPRNALGKPLRRQLAQAYESELRVNDN
jgi:acyl-coenzyme A synthetase/AMP-(fatty) acid ligase